jgi:hypothetical protein
MQTTALLPTMKPEKIYGGITTALKTIEQIRQSLPSDTDLRVIATSDTVDRASVAELTKRLGRDFTLVNPSDDVAGATIVGLAEAQHSPVALRPNDVFIATAWWTADLGYRLIDQQKILYGKAGRLAYIIQDYEPGFYNWSNTYALAEATYHRRQETYALINSEELANFLSERYHFANVGHLPFELHPQLAQMVKPQKPRRLILVYGRPSVQRNCFELLVEGLRVWQARQPQRNGAFEIVFAGEEFAPDRLSELQNARTTGKMAIEQYAEMLSEAAIGVSLMVSPHPSYPPLEMAYAGCITISNAYERKDPSRRADNLLSLQRLTPAALADCLEKAVADVDFTTAKQCRDIRALPTEVPVVDYGRVAKWLSEATA